MRLSALAVVLFLGGLAAVSWADAQEPIAEGPEQICPLVIGAHIPDVTLVTVDRQPVVLREALAKQPTILIYYRGGW